MNHRLVAIAASMSLLAAVLSGCEKDSADGRFLTTTTFETSAGPDGEWQPDGATAGDAATPAPPAFTREQLEQLVAPIALYPDALLMEILMAATYPAEVAEAAIWVKEHPDLVGKELDDAIADKNWDVSVKAVTHAPQALELMAADPQWTRDLGDAFLAQQNDVLNAVQVMRQKACDLGTLKTTEQQQVVIEDAPPQATQPAPASYVVPPPQQVVRILPVQENVFYVPYYNPRVIYGPPPPTVYYPRAWMYPAFRVGVAPVISFGVGLTIGALLWGDADWYHGRVYHHHHWYDHRHDYYRYGRPYRADYWRHDPYHRRGISYPTRYVEHRIFERHDEARERYQRGSREFEGRLPRSGGWERALADDRRGDRFRDLQRDRERTDRLDGDRDRFRDGERDRFGPGGQDARDRFEAERRDAERRGDRDADRRPGGDARGPSRGPGDSGDSGDSMDRGDRGGRGPGGGSDRDAERGSGRGGRAVDRETGQGPGGGADRGPNRGEQRGPARAPERDERGPDKEQDRGGRGPDRGQGDRGPSRGPAGDAERGPRGPERMQPDRGPGRGADRPDADRGRGSGAGGGPSREERAGKPDAGQGPERGGGPSRSPGVSGKAPSDRGRPESARPDRPSRPPASGAPSLGSPGGDRSPRSGGSVRAPSGDQRGGGRSVQPGGRGGSGSRDGGSVQRSAPQQRGGGSVQRSAPQQRSGGQDSRRGGQDSRGGGKDSRGGGQGRGRGN